VNAWSRARSWARAGPSISRREFLISYLTLFLLVTIVLASQGYLIRENHDRVNDVRHAVIDACRDTNELRAQARQVIQDVKDHAQVVPLTASQRNRRYEALTAAQARLADTACLPLP
jgi:hypothetical protein